ncbi:hypothetical protein KP509_02G061700 [Ceratopteris richardii]|nr:hypothetical protein KP509_02G061700 [Ceratopteris richardii]
MELVTAVLGDHGQRPLHDYVVVTAVTDLNGKPRFFSTPELIAFCRQWRLPTNHVWLFSTRKSATSFFTAYDALCEEGIATEVSRTLDEVSDVSAPGSKSHTVVQGEILEGLVARIVSPESAERMKKVLQDYPLQVCMDSEKYLPQKGLREIYAQHMASEEEQVKALLNAVGSDMCSDWSDWGLEGTNNSLLYKFLKATPLDLMTKKFQEMLNLLLNRNMKVRYPCRYKGFDAKERKTHFRMTVHVLDDYVFRKYQIEMKRNPDLWPLYRGFFVDVYIMHGDRRPESVVSLTDRISESLQISHERDNGSADEVENLMVKLKFLPYKIRTFLIRNGLSTLFDNGFPAYRKYYLKQMGIWKTSFEKQQQLDWLLTEWAQYITSKYRGRGPNNHTYLSEAEPFLEQFAKRSTQNKRLVGYTGSVTATESLKEEVIESSALSVQESLTVAKQEKIDMKGKGMVIFFPAIPGCGKSAVCKELLNDPGELVANGRSIHSLMGDLVKGKYWPLLAKERQKRPKETITLADKNAPNVEVWDTVRDICNDTSAIGVPVVPDSPGTELNPFALDALALFMYRVIQRQNHPGNLDKESPNAGYVLLMFYNLYSRKNRKEFEGALRQQFGFLVKLPILKPERPPLPSAIQDVLSEGLDLFGSHSRKHGKLDSSKGSLSQKWSIWEKNLRQVLNRNAVYFNDIQTPFKEAFESVRQQLIAILKGEVPINSAGEEVRSFNNITYAALTLPVNEVTQTLQHLAATNIDIENYFCDRMVILNSAHVTLAHKHAHGVAAVAKFGDLRGVEVPVMLTAFLFSAKLCALEARIMENEKGIYSRNPWPHVTVWTAKGTRPKESNFLPQMLQSGHAWRVDFAPVVLSGVVELL